METESTEIERFEAIAENGHRFTIVVYQAWLQVRSFDDPAAQPIPGMQYARTTTGKTVRRQSDEVYDVLDGLRVIQVTKA